MEGYGIFWFLIESLANSSGEIPLETIPILAMQMRVKESKVESVIRDFGLFAIDDKSFTSSRLNEHLQFRKKLSEKGKEGIMKRWKNREADTSPNSPPIKDPNTKERKGKEKKGNDNVVVDGASAPTPANDFDSRKLKFKLSLAPYVGKYSNPLLREFFEYWSEPNKSRTRFRQEMEKTWDLDRRLRTWAERDYTKKEKIERDATKASISIREQEDKKIIDKYTS
jgi:hypothetical protein